MKVISKTKLTKLTKLMHAQASSIQGAHAADGDDAEKLHALMPEVLVCPLSNNTL